jgi:hypothetical protein
VWTLGPVTIAVVAMLIYWSGVMMYMYMTSADRCSCCLEFKTVAVADRAFLCMGFSMASPQCVPFWRSHW